MKSFFGLMFLIAIVIVAVVAVPTIFGAQEESMNMTNSSYYDQYNSTTSIITFGLSGSNVVFYLLIIAMIIIGLGAMYRYVT
jgi:hypothetical protein